MSNPRGNPATLKKYTPKWNSGETRTIRVPIAIADQVLEYAHKLDNNSLSQVNTELDSKNEPVLSDKLKETLTQVIKAIEDVCETPHTMKFRKSLKSKLVKDAIAPLKALTQENE